MPKVPVDFAGPSYFGGKNNELVLCAGKGTFPVGSCNHFPLTIFGHQAGDIHIWDQESGALLHHVRAQALGGDLTCIAWNHAAEDPFMFATGSHDGAVRIWTKPPNSPYDTHAHDGAPLTRTHSPFQMEEIPRSESPVAQQDMDSVDISDGPHNGSGLLLKERVVAFLDRPSNFAPDPPT